MVIVIDADYDETTKKGHVAGIVCETALDDHVRRTVTAIVENISDYCPGQFYKRELQCVDAILEQVDLDTIGMIIVDGFADFGTDVRSLGTYVYDNYHLPVIGIAKNPYKPCIIKDIEVTRGSSNRPLFVTCMGMDHGLAKEIVRQMAGENRIPFLVKEADKIARDWNI